MTYISLVDKVHEILAEVIQPGDFVIDATVGNGYDTVFLAQAVGDTGSVLGFDVQIQALENTRRVLQEHNLQGRVRLLLQSHNELIHYISTDMCSRLKAVVFNLGYLPGSNKMLTTCSRATLSALNGALSQLMPGGVITVVAYRGHSGGAEEARAVLDWATQQDPAEFAVTVIKPPVPSEKSPLLVIINKRLQKEYS